MSSVTTNEVMITSHGGTGTSQFFKLMERVVRGNSHAACGAGEKLAIISNVYLLLSNTAQYELIKLFASKHKNLCVVGDDDQSIYGWRGANIYNILNFENDFNGAKVIKLEQNYRSTQNILEAANSVIKNNPKRKAKRLWTQNEKGNKIIYNKAKTDIEEASFVIARIKEHVRNGGKYNDMSVLYRQNSLSRLIEDQLVKNSIPYRLFGGVRFYDRREIKDILAYLKVINNLADDISMKRIINVPRRGIGDTSVSTISMHAFENSNSFFEVLKNIEDLDIISRPKKMVEFRELINELILFASENPVSALIQKILDEIEYIEELKREDLNQAQTRIENIKELVNKAVEFESQTEGSNLSDFLQDISLVADIDSHSEDEDIVSLMTLHSSKGLEFPYVFMIGFEEDIFPSFRSIAELRENFNDNLMEEERRLCYVGVTRAKKALYITSSTSRLSYGKTVNNETSRFLKEIPQNLLIDYSEYASVQKSSEKPLGLSQFAGIKIFSDSIDAGIGRKKYQNTMPVSENIKLDFEIGDSVSQARYGVGTVKKISPAGADYEITIEFENAGTKKFMAHLSKLKKI